ncbi:MAG: trypsin-like peptidase domain-containing protein [Chloroflexota bacterium]
MTRFRSSHETFRTILLTLAVLVACQMAPARAADAAEPVDNAIAQLEIQFGNVTGTCTGFFIGPRTLATAGHCLYRTDMGQATSIAVSPGRNGINYPIRTINALRWKVAPDWNGRRLDVSDYGMITLPADVTGITPFKLVLASDSELNGAAVSSAGYPFDHADQQWSFTGVITGVGSHEVFYNVATAEGASGSPLRLTSGQGRDVAGIHHARLTSGGATAVRVDAAMFEFFESELGRGPAIPQATLDAANTIFIARPRDRVVLTVSGPASTRFWIDQTSDNHIWTRTASGVTNSSGRGIAVTFPIASAYYRVTWSDGSVEPIRRGVVSANDSSAYSPWTATKTFVAKPTFGPDGKALAIFGGGSIDDLEAAARAESATGVWIQDSSGAYVLLVVDGPPFLKASLVSRLAGALTTVTSVTLTK